MTSPYQRTIVAANAPVIEAPASRSLVTGGETPLQSILATYSRAMEASRAKHAFMGDPAKKAERTAALKSAFADRQGSSFQKLGDAVSTAIQETVRRHGFTRRTLQEDVANGPSIQIRVSKMDVQAQIVIDKETVTTQDVRAYWFTPPEFSIDTKITISNKDLAQVGPELMDEKFNDGLVSLWTREDRLTRQMFVNAQGVYNTPFGFSSFTPAVLAAMKNQVESWGLTATTLLVSFDIWNDIMTNVDFQNFFSPLEKHDIALEGRIGRLMGMEIVTDGYQYDTIKVLNRGEVFVLAAPATLGKVVQRQALEATAIDERVNGIAARGWFLEQIQAQAVVNAMGVAYGVRV